MENIKEIEVKDTRRVHEFFCDKCGKKFFESTEYNDGYYEEPDNNKIVLFSSIYCGDPCHIKTTRFNASYKKMLCDDCTKELTLRFKKYILDFGLIENGML